MTSYPSRRVIRLKDYDYSQAGMYFITLCTEERQCLFGTIRDGEMHLNPAGEMVHANWEGLAERFSGIEMDEFVVMPNHVHGIILVREDEPKADARNAKADTAEPVPTMAVHEIIRRFKTFTANRYLKGVAGEGWQPFVGRLRQVRFHDRIIRNERELTAIREYIVNNPMQWHLDSENPEV